MQHTHSLAHTHMHPPTHSLTHSLTHKGCVEVVQALNFRSHICNTLTHPPTHSLTRPLTHSLTHSHTHTHAPTHSLTHSLTRKGCVEVVQALNFYSSSSRMAAISTDKRFSHFYIFHIFLSFFILFVFHFFIISNIPPQCCFREHLLVFIDFVIFIVAPNPRHVDAYPGVSRGLFVSIFVFLFFI